MAQSVERPTLAQLMISWFVGSSPIGACFRFCISLSLCPSPTHAVSLSRINKYYIFFLEKKRGTWVVQSVERLTLGFCSGYDPRIVGSSPVLGSCAERGAALRLSLSPSAPLPCSCALFLNKIIKIFRFQSHWLSFTYISVLTGHM